MRNDCVPKPAPSARRPLLSWPLKPAEPVRHRDSSRSSTWPSCPPRQWEGPSVWALQPCLNFSPGRWAWPSLLCTPLPELRVGRDQKHLKSKGNKVEKKRGQGEAQGVRKGGRRRGRNAGGSGWELCQRCYKQRVLSNTICPEIKGSETETQRPIRRQWQWQRQRRPGQPGMELLQ